MGKTRLQEVLDQFCSNYNVTRTKIAQEAGISRSNITAMTKRSTMNLDTYFKLCTALSRLSNMYDEGYYLVRIKHALTMKQRNDNE